MLQYYNVQFYIYIQNENDLININYFLQNNNDIIKMRDIHIWCNLHNINYTAYFKYRKDFPIVANLWNFYSFIHACKNQSGYNLNTFGHINKSHSHVCACA